MATTCRFSLANGASADAFDAVRALRCCIKELQAGKLPKDFGRGRRLGGHPDKALRRIGVIKILGLLTRKEGLTHDQFVRHWFDIHGPLALAVPGVRRYVQSHITGTRTRPDIPETNVDVDGIAELWYNDAETAARAAASPEMKRLTDDGALFIGRIKTYVIEERQIIPPPG
jgi:uncharacterized protein (TIGR02118 family)